MKHRALACALMGCLAVTNTMPAWAGSSYASGVALDSAVYVERESGLTRSLQTVERLSRGDRIVTILSWQKQRGSGGFTVVNPLPPKVSYQGSARDDEEVSVDGGRTWGRLGELSFGTRQATPEDVTHVRWRVASNQAALGQGRIAYSAIVR